MKPIRKTHPITNIISQRLIDLPAPINISIWWNYGSLFGLFLIVQVIRGIFLYTLLPKHITSILLYSSHYTKRKLRINNTQHSHKRSILLPYTNIPPYSTRNLLLILIGYRSRQARVDDLGDHPGVHLHSTSCWPESIVCRLSSKSYLLPRLAPKRSWEMGVMWRVSVSSFSLRPVWVCSTAAMRSHPTAATGSGLWLRGVQSYYISLFAKRRQKQHTDKNRQKDTHSGLKAK